MFVGPQIIRVGPGSTPPQKSDLSRTVSTQRGGERTSDRREPTRREPPSLMKEPPTPRNLAPSETDFGPDDWQRGVRRPLRRPQTESARLTPSRRATRASKSSSGLPLQRPSDSQRGGRRVPPGHAEIGTTPSLCSRSEEGGGICSSDGDAVRRRPSEP